MLRGARPPVARDVGEGETTVFTSRNPLARRSRSYPDEAPSDSGSPDFSLPASRRSDASFPRVCKPEGFAPSPRRVTCAARLLVRRGIVPIVATITPHHGSWAEARREIGVFVRVHLAMQAEVCEACDSKGVSARGRRGAIRGFDGSGRSVRAARYGGLPAHDGRRGPLRSVDQILRGSSTRSRSLGDGRGAIGG